MVTEFSPTDIEALYFVRLHLERLAARLSFYNLGPDDLEKLRKINGDLRRCHKRKGNLFELIEGDRQFHRTIYQASKNSFLIRLIDDLRLKCYGIAYYGWRDPDRVRVSIEEHGEIIEALRRKDRARFQGLIERQLNSAKSFYVEGVE